MGYKAGFCIPLIITHFVLFMNNTKDVEDASTICHKSALSRLRGN
jgi:hypothetical protein